jgi:hypothetical protein
MTSSIAGGEAGCSVTLVGGELTDLEQPQGKAEVEVESGETQKSLSPVSSHDIFTNSDLGWKEALRTWTVSVEGWGNGFPTSKRDPEQNPSQT